MTTPEDVLTYWLPEIKTPEQMSERSAFWFSGGDAVDAEIRERFGSAVEQARDGKLDAWTATPRSALALIILIDQFSRNLYRGSPAAFSADAKALALTSAGYDNDSFTGFTTIEHLFATMPLQHAEDIECQKRGVALCVRHVLSAPALQRGMMVGSVDFARKHLDVIARFGRFPHRNQTLGRESTPQEVEYLAYLKMAKQWL
jgi:uncharacterized protein (DUF924 family)